MQATREYQVWSCLQSDGIIGVFLSRKPNDHALTPERGQAQSPS